MKLIIVLMIIVGIAIIFVAWLLGACISSIATQGRVTGRWPSHLIKKLSGRA